MGFEVMGTSFRVGSNYKFCKALGKGAYGVVCSAENTNSISENGKPVKVAIKKIKPMSKTVYDAKHTLREVRLLRYCGKHPNIVTLKDLICNSMHDEVYIIMECMDTDLHRIIQSSQKLSEAHLKHFIFQLLRGLDFLHSNGILHRDLKPANLLVSKNCDLRISDFGLARKAADPHTDGLKYQPMTEHVVTRWYRPPELMLSPDGKYTSAVDMWSVGCICAEIVGRTPLFPGKNFVHQLQLIFDVIGTPQPAETSFIRNSQALEFLRNQPFKRQVHLRTVFPGCDPNAADFMSQCLRFTAKNRLSTKEAMNHPFFDKAPYRNVATSPVSFDVDEVFQFETEKLNEIKLREIILAEVKDFRNSTLRNQDMNRNSTSHNQDIKSNLRGNNFTKQHHGKGSVPINSRIQPNHRAHSSSSRQQHQYAPASQHPESVPVSTDSTERVEAKSPSRETVTAINRKAAKREQLLAPASSSSDVTTLPGPQKTHSKYTFDMASIMQNVRSGSNQDHRDTNIVATSTSPTECKTGHENNIPVASKSGNIHGGKSLNIPHSTSSVQLDREQVVLLSSARGTRSGGGNHLNSLPPRTSSNQVSLTSSSGVNSEVSTRRVASMSDLSRNQLSHGSISRDGGGKARLDETKCDQNQSVTSSTKLSTQSSQREFKIAHRSTSTVANLRKTPTPLATSHLGTRTKGFDGQYSSRSSKSIEEVEKVNTNRGWSSSRTYVQHRENMSNTSNTKAAAQDGRIGSHAKRRGNITIPKPFSFRIPERRKQWKNRRAEQQQKQDEEVTSKSTRSTHYSSTEQSTSSASNVVKNPSTSELGRRTTYYRIRPSSKIRQNSHDNHECSPASPSSERVETTVSTRVTTRGSTTTTSEPTLGFRTKARPVVPKVPIDMVVAQGTRDTLYSSTKYGKESGIHRSSMSSRVESNQLYDDHEGLEQKTYLANRIHKSNDRLYLGGRPSSAKHRSVDSRYSHSRLLTVPKSPKFSMYSWQRSSKS